MRRSALPIILIVLSLLVAMLLGALIITGRIPPDAPYLPYALPALGLALLASIGLAIWQYRLDHRGPSDEQVPGASPQVNVAVNVQKNQGGNITGAVINLPRDARAKRNRRAMLAKVKSIWITGFLEQQSLAKELRIVLDLAEHPDAVTFPLNALVQELRRPPRTLPAGTQIIEVFDTIGGALLILGAPGAGKTTLLLELARDLIARAEQDDDHPIPVVFNLSSWAERRLPLHEWLREELQARYDVPRKLAQVWMDADVVLPLLDGLDEVTAEQRDNCVAAINTYRRGHGLIPLAVCSRVKDYEALTSRLKLQGAIVVKPLTPSQVDKYFERGGVRLAGVRAALQGDTALGELLETPLMLSIAALAYQNAVPADLEGLDVVITRRRLFDHYIVAMFERRGGITYSTPSQTIHHLTWLAQQLVGHNQTSFYIEQMQPNWLSDQQLLTYQALMSLLIAPLIGLFYGLLIGLFYGLFIYSLTGLLFGLLIGLFCEPLMRDIEVTEILRLPWSRETLHTLVGGLLIGLLIGLFMGLVTAPLFGLLSGLVFWLLSGLVFGLFSGLVAGLSRADLSAKAIPNQGIRRSIRSWLVFGLLIGLAFGLLIGLAFGLVSGLVNGLVNGLLIGLLFGQLIGLNYGGLAFFQHYTLRCFFARNGSLPLRLIPFLDFCVERILLRRVGGGYIFVHRLLMEHFAALDQPTSGEDTTQTNS